MSKSIRPAMNRSNLHVLVIDDDEIAREFICDILRRAGFTAEDEASTLGVTNRLIREHFHVVVLDVMMPKLGGPATAAKLARLIDHLPAVFTSGYSQENNGVAGVGAGEHYLQKPYSPTALARLVRTVLDHARVPTLA